MNERFATLKKYLKNGFNIISYKRNNSMVLLDVIIFVHNCIPVECKCAIPEFQEKTDSFTLSLFSMSKL